MPKKRSSDIDVWLGRETPRIRRALESASRYFDVNDKLTVNTLEAVYARESSFGTMLGKRGVDGPSGRCTEGHWRTIDDRPVFICDSVILPSF